MVSKTFLVCRKKKKSKSKDIQRVLEKIATASDSGSEEASSSLKVDKRTKAEIAFEKVKKKRVR